MTLAPPRYWSLLLLGWLSFTCGDPVGLPEIPDVREWVTGEASRALDANGHFRFAAPVQEGQYPMIDGDQARAFALAFVQTAASPDIVIGTSLGELLERQHGAPIRFDDLEPLERVLFALSPYVDVPAEYPHFIRRAIGPDYVVRLMDRGTPVVGVSVSAYATNVRIEEGRLHRDPPTGEEFNAHGIPKERGLAYPVTPEEAVRTAATATDARVKNVPELIEADWMFLFLEARWRLVLDRRVLFDGVETGERYSTDTIYVGSHDRPLRTSNRDAVLLAPLADQPRADTLGDYITADSTRAPVILHLRPDRPVRFEEVVPAGG